MADKVYYAHSDPDGKSFEADGHWHLLKDHLLETAELAKEFASAFDAGGWGYLAGLLHDLGKYADQFQKRLRNNFEKGRDHSTAGAAAILSCYKTVGLISALAVQGHHTGLQQILGLDNWLSQIKKNVQNNSHCFTDANFNLLMQRFKSDGLGDKLAKLNTSKLQINNKDFTSEMLDTRMLFSALVDADFLNTEAHFNGDRQTPLRYRPQGSELDIEASIRRFGTYLEELRTKSMSSENIQKIRDSLMDSCIKAAEQSSGLFTLSSPTGTGKTLSMLAFALHHARKHRLRRIVLVMPYLNIIDQTSNVYRKIFSSDFNFPKNYVLEDHSLVQHGGSGEEAEDYENLEKNNGRLLAENWDAPIILTTTVKCLESLMSNRSSSCRKLHRLAKSIILFDEVQTLPPKLVVPTIATLARLADPNGPFKSTIVFSTATQPAFDHLDKYVAELNSTGWKPREIVTNIHYLYSAASNRIKVDWQHNQQIKLAELADKLVCHQQVMCIVNLKRHARDLAEMLDSKKIEGLFHLSTNMCPAHRKVILNKISEHLADKKIVKPVRLIATQCVEAGVDIDFPMVYRALAPLESLAQAAGRCNRNGNRPETGKVVVFRFASDGHLEYPPGYGEGVNATNIFLNSIESKLENTEIFNDPFLLRKYYQQFYDLTNYGKGDRKDEKDLRNSIEAGDFVRVAEEYKLIKQDAINILVPYDKGIFENLIKQVNMDGFHDLESIRQWIMNARPYAVNMFRPKSGNSVWNCLKPVQFSSRENLSNEEADWFMPLGNVEYNEIGLKLPEDIWIV